MLIIYKKRIEFLDLCPFGEDNNVFYIFYGWQNENEAG
jgi:hypothetical protein